VLKWNGSAWINDTDATGGGGGALDDLTDVTITAAATVASMPAAAAYILADGANGAGPGTSTMSDILAYEGAMSSGERAVVAAWLAARNGL
jgi:hypothetical protein